MADTKVLKCSCNSVYQDKNYAGKRLHNKTTKPSTYRCTVCGKNNTSGSEK